MKVVINGCFGGFGLSPLATKKLAERKGRECFFFKTGRTAAGEIDLYKHVPISLEEAESTFMWFAYDIPNPDETLPSTQNWCEMSMEERGASNKLWSQHSIGFSDISRNDPDLIALVEELGDAASGQCSKLEIVEIPDDVKYVIEEYDGNEHIAEEHRTWR